MQNSRDEESPLLKSDASTILDVVPHNPNQMPELSTKAKWGTNAAGIVFAVGCVMVLLKPCQKYADTNQSSFNLFLKDNIPESWLIYFITTAIELGLTNFYFAKESLPKLIKFRNEQKNKVEKGLVTVGVPILSASQAVGHAAITKAVDGTDFIATFVFIGQVAPGIYTVTNVLSHDLPELRDYFKRKKVKNAAQKNKETGHLAIYEAQGGFGNRMRAGWLDVLKKFNQARSANKIKEDDFTEKSDEESSTQEPMSATFDEKNVSTWNLATHQQSWELFAKDMPTEEQLDKNTLFPTIVYSTLPEQTSLEKLLRSLFQTIGFGAAVNLLMTMVGNIIAEFIEQSTDPEKTFLPADFVQDYLLLIQILAGTIGALTGLGTMYFVSRFLTSVTGYAFDAIQNALEGKPIDWLAFQLRPKTMIAGGIAGAFISIPTFATINVLFNKLYAKILFAETLGTLTSINIDILHAIGFVKLLNLTILAIAESPTASKDEKILMNLSKALNKAIELADPLKEKEFIEVMQKLPKATRLKLLGSKAALFENSVVIAKQNLPEEKNQEAAQKPKKRSLSCTSSCNIV